MNPTGYILPAERTPAQRLFDTAFFSTAGYFSDQSEGYLDALPERALLVDLEIALIGTPTYRVHQQSGSCVGAAAAHAYAQSMVGDVTAAGGDRGGREFPFPWGAYGRGRELGGFRSKGEGSFGSVQAVASTQQEFGMLRWDDPRLPKPEIVLDEVGSRWMKYTKQQEIDWSYAPQWPVAYEELREDAAEQGFADQTQIRTVHDAQQASAQGYGLTIAAGFLEMGKVTPTDGLLISDFRHRGGHQQGIGGYLTHPKHGLLWQIDNNWADVHGHDEILAPMGVVGSYWIRNSRFEQLLRDPQTEVMAVNASGTWKTRKIDWSDVFSYYD